MNKKDYLILEEAYNKVLVNEAYDTSSLPHDQQATIHKLEEHGFKIVGYKTQSGQKVMELRKMGVSAHVDSEGFINDEENADDFLLKFKPSRPEEKLRGLTNREVEKDIAAQRMQRGAEGYAERKHEHGALHGDVAYNNYKESTSLEDVYAKLLSESQDIDPRNTDHKHPFNRVDNDPHSGTQKTGSYKLPVVEADEEEDHVEKTEKEKVEDVKDKEEEESSKYKKSEEGEHGDNEKLEGKEEISVEEEDFDLLSAALDIIKEAKKKAVSGKKNINPWAVEKALEKKTGHHYGKEKKERIVKGIKKGAEKYGKKITSKPVKKSK